MRIDRFKLLCELKKRELTQRDLAEMSKISRNTINGLCQGRACSRETGEAIAEALGVELSCIEESF